MKPTRILLLVIAVLAAGLAAYLATRGGSTPRAVQEIVQIEAPKTQVLVAAEQIGVGQRLTPKLLQWQDWPESAVREEYVTVSSIPDAPEQLTGTIARFEIFPGEPIMQSKLVHASQGYLSAVLEKGMRAVSFPVAAESSAGGFVIPNDRVDVVQTLSGEAGLQTNTVIQNVKVLAIGVRLGERGVTAGDKDQQNPRSQVFQAGTIATIEVTPDQAEIMVTAIRKGGLSLVLRSIKDFEGPALLINASSDSQSVKLVRFGKQTSVVPPSTSVPEAPPVGAADYTGSPMPADAGAGMATPQ